MVSLLWRQSSLQPGGWYEKELKASWYHTKEATGPKISADSPENRWYKAKAEYWPKAHCGQQAYGTAGLLSLATPRITEHQTVMHSAWDRPYERSWLGELLRVPEGGLYRQPCYEKCPSKRRGIFLHMSSYVLILDAISKQDEVYAFHP